MSVRDLPVRPDLEQLRRQARELHRALRRGDPAAVAELRAAHPSPPEPERAKLADAQLVLARSYRASSWPRLVLACRLSDAIWRDDADAVLALVARHPRLVREQVILRESGWGPPLTYAANLGRDRIIRMLLARDARDLESALARAALQGQVETARLLHALLGHPRPPADALEGPAYTLSVAGTAFLLEVGARVRDDDGRRLAPVDVVLETDSRDPAAKHAILELYVRHGVELPDTPTMALHRGRLDLLEAHLRRDPDLLRRTFTHEEIYPPALGCHDEVLATHGTPLAGATLLHMCADYGELEIARWLLDRGMDPDVRAAVDADGFGGHTALHSAVVSQVNYRVNQHGRRDDAPVARLLLDHGADPGVRASLRKRLHPGYGDDRLCEYRDVTPLAWGERFHFPMLVSRAAMRLIAERAGAADRAAAVDIREAHAGDVPALARLHVETFVEAHGGLRPPTYALRERQWREAFADADERRFCFVAETAAGELVGFAKGVPHDGGVAGFGGELNKIYVLRRWQRRGIGRRLVGHVARRFVAQGIEAMLLFGDARSPSNAFYERLGAERLLTEAGEFHGGYGWRELRELAARCPVD